MCQEPKTVVSFTVSETDTHVTTTLSIEKKDLDDLDTFLARVNLMFVRTLHGAQIYQERLASNRATPQAEHPEAGITLVSQPDKNEFASGETSDACRREILAQLGNRKELVKELEKFLTERGSRSATRKSD